MAMRQSSTSQHGHGTWTWDMDMDMDMDMVDMDMDMVDMAMGERSGHLAQPLDVSPAGDHALLHLEQDAHSVARRIAHRHRTVERRAHEGGLDANLDPKLVGSQNSRGSAFPAMPRYTLRGGVLVERFDRQLKARATRGVGLSDGLGAAELDHRALEKFRAGIYTPRSTALYFGNICEQQQKRVVCVPLKRVWLTHRSGVESCRNDLLPLECWLVGSLQLLAVGLSLLQVVGEQFAVREAALAAVG
eukprot:1476488-Prymnesium_polylepis.2